MDDIPDMHQISARIFIDHCKDMFGWGDLSGDVIMDVGCGEHGHCGTAMLEKFPDVRAIICIDVNPRVVRNFRPRSKAKIDCEVANIEKIDSLRNYEGRMSKVFSTHAFHQLIEKEEAFRNVYRLLKPGGAAAILFVTQSLIYEWLTELLKNPTWKKAYQRRFVEDLYKTGFGKDQYNQMVEKIGFRVVECSEEEKVIPYQSDQVCKDALYQMCGNTFKIPPELLEEFKEDCLQVLLKLSARDAEGRPCYRSTELSLLHLKPDDGSGSKTKRNLEA